MVETNSNIFKELTDRFGELPIPNPTNSTVHSPTPFHESVVGMAIKLFVLSDKIIRGTEPLFVQAEKEFKEYEPESEEWRLHDLMIKRCKMRQQKVKLDLLERLHLHCRLHGTDWLKNHAELKLFYETGVKP